MQIATLHYCYSLPLPAADIQKLWWGNSAGQDRQSSLALKVASCHSQLHILSSLSIHTRPPQNGLRRADTEPSRSLLTPNILHTESQRPSPQTRAPQTARATLEPYARPRDARPARAAARYTKLDLQGTLAPHPLQTGP